MAMSGKILDLRNLLAIHFPQAPLLVETRLVTGLASIDQRHEILIAICAMDEGVNERCAPRASSRAD